ncbi:MAG TPA: outer membrane beta-barrel protein [Steroidobacteraceae bacterium]
MKTTFMAAGAALALISLPAAAADTGFYISGNFGQAQYGDLSQDEFDEVTDIVLSELGVTLLNGGSSLDDEGSPWSLVAGWRFSPYFALEAGYVNLGTAEYRASGTVFIPGIGSVNGGFGVDISAKGPLVAVAGFAPLGERFDVHGRLGLLFADTEFDVTVSLEGLSESDSFSASSQDVFFGIGASFHFTDNLSASLDYSLFQDVGDEDETGESKVDAITLGLTYRF